jgi:hypothetical protein
MLQLTRSQRAARNLTLLFTGVAAAFVGAMAATLSIAFLTTVPPANVGLLYWHQVGWFALAAAFSSLLIGPLLWWCQVIRPDHLTLRRGVFIGMLGSVLVHPLAWSILLLLGINNAIALNGQISNPLVLLETSLWLSFWSLFLIGWLTLLIGGIFGALLALVQQKIHCPTYWATTPQISPSFPDQSPQK